MGMSELTQLIRREKSREPRWVPKELHMLNIRKFRRIQKRRPRRNILILGKPDEPGEPS